MRAKAPASWVTRPQAASSAKATRAAAEGAARVDRDHRQAEFGMRSGSGRRVGCMPSRTTRRRRAAGDEGQAENAQAAHFQQPGQGGGAAAMPSSTST